MCDFTVRHFAPRITSSLTLNNSSAILMFHFSFFLFIFDQDHISHFYLDLFCVMHHTAPFLKGSQILFSSSFLCSLLTLVDMTLVSLSSYPSGIIIGTHTTKYFVLKLTFESSIYVSGRLFSTISVSIKTCSSSCLVMFSLRVALSRDCFTNPTIFSNCLFHHDALPKLNYHFVLFLNKVLLHFFIFVDFTAPL